MEMVSKNFMCSLSVIYLLVVVDGVVVVVGAGNNHRFSKQNLAKWLGKNLYLKCDFTHSS